MIKLQVRRQHLRIHWIGLTFQVPSTGAVEVWRRCDHDDLNIVADVLVELEVLGVVFEVLPHLRVVHVVGVVLGDRVVTVAHHLLAGVDDSGTHHARLAVPHLLGVLPQSSHFIRALQAHRFQSFVHTAFDGRQTATPSSDDGYPFGHLESLRKPHNGKLELNYLLTGIRMATEECLSIFCVCIFPGGKVLICCRAGGSADVVLC